jgi:hypothetical protein
VDEVEAPASVDRRAPRAPRRRWIRESTAGQVDRFGPDAQREQQDRAIERYELVDTGIAWQVAHSGRTIAATGQWAEMLAGAGESWDVLVVGYVSRFARDLRTAVNARHDLHAAGAAILFADERLLTRTRRRGSSGPGRPSRPRPTRGGSASGSGRATPRSAGASPTRAATRRSASARRRRARPRAGSGQGRDRPAGVRAQCRGAIDREVAAAVSLPLPTIRGVLRSRLYKGELEDGSRTRFAPPIPSDLWELAAAARDRRRRQRGRRPVRQPYALSMLACAACGRRLVGDGGRYRHLELCPEFSAAVSQARRRRPGQHRIPLGASYPAATYEAAVSAVLERVAVGADVAVQVVENLVGTPADPDRLVLARLERERRAAADRFVRDRDQQRSRRR